MSRFFLLAILSVQLCADIFTLSLKDQRAKSSYTVEDPQQQLRSELLFPKHFTTLGIAYTYTFLDYDFTLSSDFLLHSKDQKGEDFDWQDDELTVYSNSNDTLNSYQHYKLQASKKISHDFALVGAFIYEDIQEHWSDTKQHNYVTDNTTQLRGKTLEFSQTFYQYLLGITYSKEVFSEFSINFTPSFVYSYIDTKDTHILRGFYVVQECHAFGYDLKLSLEKKLTINTALGLHLQYINFEDKQTDMRYYFSSSKNLFATYPSSYRYQNLNLNITYQYKF